MNIWCRKEGGLSEYFFLLPLEESGYVPVLDREMDAFVVETVENDMGIRLVHAGKHHGTVCPQTLRDYDYHYLSSNRVRDLLKTWVQRGVVEEWEEEMGKEEMGDKEGGKQFLKAIVETRNGYLV